MDFTLRQWATGDIYNLVKYADNTNISRFMTDSFPSPYTEEKGRAFIEFATTNTVSKVFAIHLGGEGAVGGIGIHPQQDIMRKNAELGYWLAEPFWGRGITTNAILKMIDYSFANLDIERIFARPFGSNIASRKVLEKTGFILEGTFEKTIFKNGQFEDELIYAIRRHRR